VVTQPLGAIAHFRHRPHAGGECQKTIVSVKYQKDQKESLEQRRQILAADLLQKLAGQNLAYCVSALCSFPSKGDFSLWQLQASFSLAILRRLPEPFGFG
jgi:hypothetical protein